MTYCGCPPHSFLEVPMRQGVLLITYPDSLGANLRELETILSKQYRNAISAVHILPFFPSSGDRGFAPLSYEQVDPAFGTWDDIEHLGRQYDLVFDYMINHISRKSPLVEAYEKEGANKDLFIDYENFWGGSPTKEQVDKIYKRKPKAPYTEIRYASKETRKLWCTFSDEQIDLNVQTSAGLSLMEENLKLLASHSAKLIRLDAFAYAIKKKETNCFFVEPETWDLLQRCKQCLQPAGCSVLPEVHEHYSLQCKMAAKGYPVYDFALPMLVLHALYFHQTRYLKHWFSLCPRNQYTTLDTHDGIGVVDVEGLLPPKDIQETIEHLYAHGANVKRAYSSEQYNNLDIYQINCTYYSALGNDDRAYLLSRAIQFFSPGVPQVYYVGMLAGSNDLSLLEQTKEGRNINRHYYTKEEVDEQLERPVVQALRRLMELRTNHPAFQGSFSMDEEDERDLTLCYTHEKESLCLKADLQTYSFTIEDKAQVLMRQ